MFPSCKYFLPFLMLILAGCNSPGVLAPVTELKWHPDSKYQHRVSGGETLFAIAFRYDTDYRTLARLNHLLPPYALRVGQVLTIHGSATFASQNGSHPVLPSHQTQKTTYNPNSGSRWLWPVTGRVATNFIPSQGKKGINIACKKGDKIHASAAGLVAYAGSGLAGYGNLIIIKHDHEYLTAYGNNAKNLVSEGQKVTAGQVIAEAGVVDRTYWGVHFEIRKAGAPVNPFNYLKKG